MNDDWRKIAELQGEACRLASRFEALAEHDWQTGTREKLLAAASCVDIASHRCQEAIVMLRPTVQTEDDPVGCMPNSALGIGVDEASPTTRPWSEVRKMRLTDETFSKASRPSVDVPRPRVEIRRDGDTRPWSEVRKLRLTDEQLAALDEPTWDTNNNGTIDNNDEAEAYAREADLRKGADDEE